MRPLGYSRYYPSPVRYLPPVRYYSPIRSYYYPTRVYDPLPAPVLKYWDPVLRMYRYRV